MRTAWYGVLVASTIVELAPVAAGVYSRVRGRLPPAHRLLACCFGFMFVQDAALWWIGVRGDNNLWIGHLGTPVQTLLLLAALAHWQLSQVEARTMRIAAAGFVVVWALLALRVEDIHMFSRIASPLRALLVVAVAAWTILRRSTGTLESPTSEAWFWASTGLLLYFGSGAILGPVSSLLYSRAPNLIETAYYTKAAINIAAYLLVARGMLCRVPSGSSGGFSSPPASYLSSSRLP